jgi:cellulose synthase/poly-beta-1,6-N-acetylglucosamine synthase-like glycosyltransferase
MSDKTLTLTIVIPVFNEEDYIAACLDSIAGQAVAPKQVILVDNNSTDDTVKIAKTYSFVTVINEPRQHQSFAQQTGFNAAGGDIIGRIDADSVLPADWTKKTLDYFAKNPEVVGITSSSQPYDVSIASAGTSVFKFYIGLASRLAGARMLWGANCAVRRSAWRKVADKVMTRGDIWEDFDLSFCLAAYGRLQFVDGLEVGSSARAVRKSLIDQTRYQFRAVRTFHHHTSLLRTLSFMTLWSSLYLMFIPVMLDKYLLKLGKTAPEVARLEAE